MIFRVLLAEDEEFVALHLKQIIEEIPDFKVINVSKDGKEALRNIEVQRPSVVFMDIDLPEMNGLMVAKEAVKLIPNINLVFVTGYSDYALEAFELYSFDYILKPMDPKRIHKTLLKIKDDVSRMKQVNNNIVIRLDDRKVFVKTEDILFVESNGHSLIIKTSQAIYTTRGEISRIEEKLDPLCFFRSHKGYIVNLKKVKEIVPSNRTYEIKMISGDKILLSREREKILREKCLI